MKHTIALLLAPAFALAAPRTSANYTIAAETTDAAGRRATSASYTADASSGGGAGISTAPGEIAKHGYIGQLYDGKTLTLAGAATVNETATLQLAPMLTLDDDTLLALAPALVAWSVDSGPITGISAAGLASADVVFTDTPAIVRGTYASFTDDLALTVLNIGTDDYRLYAADGLDDAWQVQFFGEENPAAAPANDADGDTQNNLFEYTTGTVPTDNASQFRLRIEPVAGQPAQRALIFQPIVLGRTYTVQFRDSLTLGDWQSLVGVLENTAGEIRTVTDTGAVVPARFYRVEVAR